VKTRYALAVAAAYAVAAHAVVPAPADAAARCKREGNAVALSDARTAPDWTRTLEAGGRADLPRKFQTGDFHAYPARGGTSFQYGCTARNGVDIWLEWRTPHGTRLARFDGVRWTALRRTVVAAWAE
jgi:hypothetical protein